MNREVRQIYQDILGYYTDRFYRFRLVGDKLMEQYANIPWIESLYNNGTWFVIMKKYCCAREQWIGLLSGCIKTL